MGSCLHWFESDHADFGAAKADIRAQVVGLVEAASGYDNAAVLASFDTLEAPDTARVEHHDVAARHLSEQLADVHRHEWRAVPYGPPGAYSTRIESVVLPVVASDERRGIAGGQLLMNGYEQAGLARHAGRVLDSTVPYAHPAAGVIGELRVDIPVHVPLADRIAPAGWLIGAWI